MSKHVLLFIIATILIVGASCADSSPSTFTPVASFAGEATRGQGFEQEIGQSLTFRLNYYSGDGEGWEIWIGNQTHPERNFSAYVTPPFRGRNGRYIEGWDFSHAPETLPQTRHFYFVLSEKDYQVANNALEKMMWPYKYSDEEVDQAWEAYEQLQTVEGVITITQLELGNPTTGELPWIEYMQFTVALRWSSE